MPSGRVPRPMPEGNGAPQSLLQVLWRGARCRCPRCGRSPLFDGYLTIVKRCQACGLGFDEHDVGDGATVFVILILGFVVVGLALLIEIRFEPPLWVHAVLWGPFVLGGAVLLLRPVKSIAVALQFRFRSTEEPAHPGGQ